MTLLPKDDEEYRGILADVEESPYFKAAPGIVENSPKPQTVEEATERKWILEELIRDEIRDYESTTGLKVDFITLVRDSANRIEKVDAKVCL